MAESGRAQRDGNWEYDLTGAISENKQVYRSGVKPPFHPEVVGTDGRLRGGLRLHPGFRSVRTLGQDVWDESDNSDAGASLGLVTGAAHEQYDIHAAGPNLYEFWPFKVRVGSDEQIRGFVYKIKSGNDSTWWIEWWDPYGTVEEQYNIVTPETDVWRTMKLLDSVSDADDMNWSVVTRGRLLYLYVRGEVPVRWYIDTTDPGKYHISTTQDTGPGARPTAPTVALDFKSWPKIYNGGAIANVRPWLEFPYFPPAASFDEDAVVNMDDEDVLEPGWYTFAYQLLDSKTGLKSQLSEYFTLARHEFSERVPYRKQKLWNKTTETYDDDLVYRSTGTPQKPTLQTPCIDTDKWDTLLIFRSLRVGAPGGEIASSILFQDLRVDLSGVAGSQWSSSSLCDLRYTHSTFLTDMALSIQPLYRNKDIFLETPPKGGVAWEYRGTIFVSDITDADISENKNVGEVRYSSLTEESPELFPPDFRYLPTNAQDEIIGHVLASDTMIALSQDRQFDITLSGGFAVFREQHQAYGVVSRFASTSYGSSGFVVTPQGVKELQVNGQMLGVLGFNHLIMEVWKDDWALLSSASDAPMGCVMHLNPTQGEVACQWWETRQLSELHRAPFRHVASGLEPNSTNDTTRAMFMSPAGRIVVADHLRDKTVANAVNEDHDGSFFSCYLDIDGDHTVEVSSTSGSGSQITVRGTPSDAESSSSSAGSWGTLADADWRDAWIYVASGGAEGEWLQISYAGAPVGNSRVIFLKETMSGSVSAAVKVVGVRLVIDPMPVDLTLWKIGDSPAKEGSNDPGLFTLRNMSTGGLLFEDVSGAGASEPEATFYFSGRRGNDDVVTERSKPETAALVEGPRDFEYYAPLETGYSMKGQSLYPRFEIICPDVDFLLTGANVSGMIDTTTRGVRT